MGGRDVKSVGRFFLALALVVSLMSCERNKGQYEILQYAKRLSAYSPTDRGAAQERGWLMRNAAWDVDVGMFEAADRFVREGLFKETLEERFTEGVEGLENLLTEGFLATNIYSAQRKLGDGFCNVEPAPAMDVEAAKKRLMGVPELPAVFSAELKSRLRPFRDRVLRTGAGPFYYADCGGKRPRLFGWADGKPVPLFNLLPDG